MSMRVLRPWTITWTLLIVLALIAVGLCGPLDGVQASAGGPALQPANPAFIDALADPSRIVPRTLDGRGLGLMPCPVDPAYTRGLQVDPGVLTAPPASYDLRTLGRVTSVKNQGAFGTCWAFASLGSLESGLLTTETWDFSEDNLALTSGFGPFSEGLYNHGGNLYMSTAYLARWGGPVTETADKYGDSYTPSGLTPSKHVQEINWIPARGSATDNTNIKNAVMQYGAAYVAMYWSDSSYKSSTSSYYYYGGTGTNHAVLIVGWNDSYSASNFATRPAGNGAFIVKNSWGTTFGSAGYFYVSYYDTAFGRSDVMAVFNDAEPTGNYTGVYQYDPLGNVVDYGYSTTRWFANAFTAQSTSSIAAVGFYTLTPNTTYQVYTGTSISSKTLRTSGTLSYMGYHTVTLPTPVSITSGQTFVVFVKVTAPSSAYLVALEYPYSGYSGAATASAGQSYVSSDGTNWTDVTTLYANTNVCLKAYVTGGGSTPQVTLTTSVSPAASGSITRSLTQTTYDQGTVVTLTATPAVGYAFSYWTGDASGSANPLSVTLDTNKSITAVFVPPGPTATRYEQDNALLTYAGTWSTAANSKYSGGSYISTNRSGSSVIATFTGTAVSYVAKTAAALGKAKVTLDDDDPVYVDLYSATAKYKQIVWSATGLDNDSHTLVIEWSGTKGKGTGYTINLDALDIVGTLTQAAAAQYSLTTTVTPAGSGTITRSLTQSAYDAGTVVTLTAAPADGYVFSYWTGDASGNTNPLAVTMSSNKSITAVFTVEGSGPPTTRYEDDNSLLSYAGTWFTGTNTLYSGGTYRSVNQSQAAVTIRFTGTAISYIARQASTMGIAKVTLDDRPVVYVDLYSSTAKYQQTVWSATGLGEGITHTLVIAWTGTKGRGTTYTINLDALDITGTLVSAN